MKAIHYQKNPVRIIQNPFSNLCQNLQRIGYSEHMQFLKQKYPNLLSPHVSTFVLSLLSPRIYSQDRKFLNKTVSNSPSFCEVCPISHHETAELWKFAHNSEFSKNKVVYSYVNVYKWVNRDDKVMHIWVHLSLVGFGKAIEFSYIF